jgi:CubicO group peptidase (beta-lactamase class C family)
MDVPIPGPRRARVRGLVSLLLAAGLLGCSRQADPLRAQAGPAPAPSPAAARPFDRAAFTAAVDGIAAAAQEKGPVVGLSIAVARGGEVVLAKGYGLADREAGAPATPDTSYPIASVSKMFTTAGILRLADEGRLTLDDPLGRWLPEARAPLSAVALRHFLSHTSGLAARPGTSTRRHVVSSLRNGLAFPAGTEWEYSNRAFAMMGLVIEKASGMSYPDYMKLVAGSAQLTSTGYCEGGRPVPNRARDYGLSAQGLKPTPYWQYEKFFAAGGLCSSVNDLLRWQRALEEGRVISHAGLEAMRRPAQLPGGVEVGYGLGTRMGQTGSHRKLGHTGGGTSNKAVLARYPDDDVTVAVLLNTEAYNARVTAMEVENQVARALLELPAAPATDVTVPVEQLQRYTGGYNELGRTTRVLVEPGTQRLVADGFGPLLPQGGDAFVDADDPGVSLVFVTRDGAVSGYLRQHEGWFVEFGRRVGEASSVPAPRARKARARRAR